MLSAIGRAGFGIALPPATRISYALAPEEGAGPLQRVPYSALTVGVYEAGRPDPAGLDPAFQAVLSQLQEQVESAEAAGELAEAHALLVVEDWQRDLKRVTLRITWTDPQTAERITHERTILRPSPAGRRSVAAQIERILSSCPSPMLTYCWPSALPWPRWRFS